jgi:septal ring factor EnvC (AmiA/AmiB activator)
MPLVFYIIQSENFFKGENIVVMLDFIIKYWLEFLLGAITAGIVAVFKYAWKGIKIHIEQTLKDEFTSMNEDLSMKFEKEDAKQSIDIKALNNNVQTLT